MTNGEKIQQMFPRKCPHIGFNENFGRIWLMQDGEDFANFTLEWWNAEYKEPTTQECQAESDKLDAAFHDGYNNGYAQARFDYEQEPTTKNLGVDCISRQAVIDELKRYFHDEYYQRTSIQDCRDCFIEDVLNHLPSVTPQEPRWIPVSDYLPVTNDEVLVTYIVNGNHKKRYVETANCFDGEWSSVNDEYRIPNTKIEIIAWCEMPKPYREVEV